MEDKRLLSPEKIKELIKETGWGIKRAESLNLLSNFKTVAEAQLEEVDKLKVNRPELREKIAKQLAEFDGWIWEKLVNGFKEGEVLDPIPHNKECERLKLKYLERAGQLLPPFGGASYPVS